MADTISAGSGISADNRLTFFAPQDLPGLVAVEASHIPGSIFATEASTALVVNFATLTADASGWCDIGPATDNSSSVPAGYAASTADFSGPVIAGALGGSDQSDAG